VSSADPFKYFRVEARELCEQLARSLEALERDRAEVERILRVAHTLKGAARVVRLPDIAEKAHALEQLAVPLREPERAVDRAAVEAMVALVDAIVGLLPAAPTASAAAEPQATAPAGAAARDEVADDAFRTVRTDVAEMDALLVGIGEVLVEVSRLRRSVEDHAAELPAALERSLATGIEQIGRELEQTRSAAELLRLVQVRTIFPALGRTARDLARSAGKSVVFEGVGGDTRLEGHLVQKVHAALVQAVRNAVAHGLETEAERTATGKPASGSIRLEVVSRGRRVSFRCIDDGRGIDVPRVERVLRARGAIAADESPGDDAIVRRLVERPVSTASAVTELAGRGVGLDVIREAAAELGAELSITTRAGRGTTVEIDAPVSITAMDVIEVEAAGARVLFPLASVAHTFRAEASEIVRVADHDALVVDGAPLPFAPVDVVLGRARKERTNVWSALVLGGGDERAVLGADRVVGVSAVLVRPVPASAAPRAIVAGVAIDAEGELQLVVDADTAVRSARSARAAPAPSRREKRKILVVDDSLTTRMLEKSILESAGYEVALAVSGEEAMEMITRERYALFLVDVEMPGMDGFTFVERTRADPAFATIPAILVTSRSSDDDKRRGHDAGASDYIVKGAFDQSALLSRIEALLR